MMDSEETNRAPDKPMQDYKLFLDEIKIRIAASEKMLSKVDEVSQTSFIWAESCFLQVRLICETLALAIVAMHQDRSISLASMRNYEPHKIFRELEVLNADFFPKASIALTPERSNSFGFDFSNRVSLTASDLKNIWSRCGDALHRGTFKAIDTGRQLPYDLVFVESSLKRFRDLLSVHTILLNGHADVCYAEMRWSENDALVIKGTLDKNDPKVSL